ncbi:MAG: hypothetical protein ACT4QE_11030, partial [Anaerolineales bacterium]
MHQHPRAIEHPFALKMASRSGQRSGVNGFTVSFILRGLGVQQGCDLLALMTRQVVAIRFSLTPIG